MNKCYDVNNIPLNVGDAVMCVQNGSDENEGTVLDLLPNNQILLDGESVQITVNASDCYCLPF